MAGGCYCHDGADAETICQPFVAMMEGLFAAALRIPSRLFVGVSLCLPCIVDAGTSLPAASMVAWDVGASPQAVATADVLATMSARCEACHSERPRLMWKAPGGLVLSSVDDVDRNAAAIYRTVVQSRAMPPIWNVTRMTEAERAQIARWFAGRPQL
ncbi:hypothetical protein LMG22931_05621 [Paraburkholderia nemoris]|nr:hypothetical protein LMG22931_05621 [Paraburkholderia nemoris]